MAKATRAFRERPPPRNRLTKKPRHPPPPQAKPQDYGKSGACATQASQGELLLQPSRQPCLKIRIGFSVFCVGRLLHYRRRPEGGAPKSKKSRKPLVLEFGSLGVFGFRGPTASSRPRVRRFSNAEDNRNQYGLSNKPRRLHQGARPVEAVSSRRTCRNREALLLGRRAVGVVFS